MIVENIEGSTAFISFARAAKKNAFTLEMWRDLTSRISRLQSQTNIRIIVLRGAEGNFCAGADITEFGEVRSSKDRASEYEQTNIEAFAAVRNCSIPTIAAIEGVCFGGGFGIAAACDLRIATDTARFCVPPAKLGLAYPVDAMQDIVNSIGAQKAKLLAYTGQVLDAGDALACGFLLEIFKLSEFENAICDIVKKIERTAPLSNRATKASINAVLSGEAEYRKKAIALGNITFDSEDYAEGRKAFSEKRNPIFRGK